MRKIWKFLSGPWRKQRLITLRKERTGKWYASALHELLKPLGEEDRKKVARIIVWFLR